MTNSVWIRGAKNLPAPPSATISFRAWKKNEVFLEGCEVEEFFNLATKEEIEALRDKLTEVLEALEAME